MGAPGSSRRVILLDLFWTRDKDPRIPLGHASLLSSLRRDTSIDVGSVVVPVNAGTDGVESATERILELARGGGAGSVDLAAGAYVWGESMLRRILASLRRQGFRERIILGGPQVSYAGPGLEALYPEADVFVRGYGEDALLALAHSPRRRALVGVHHAGEVDRCEQAHIDLEALPSPWLDGTIPLTSQRFVRWETQRGCPYRCAFCQHREAGGRLRHRQLASPRVARELALFCDSGVQDIAVLDPIFNLGDQSVAVLEALAARRYGGRIALQCRAESCDVEFLDAAAQLDATLEFGLQTIHPNEGRAIQRMNRIDRVEETLAKVQMRGLDHEVSLIFGLPLQTLQSFKESVRWCLERRIPTIKAFPLLLLRGTSLDADRARWGLVDGGGSMPMAVASATFSGGDWLEMARISQALAITEGRHPHTIRELLEIARMMEPECSRWRADNAMPEPMTEQS
jgi:hypothetical protein